MTVSGITLYCLCGHSEFVVERANHYERHLKCLRCERRWKVSWELEQ